jgi:hypothetical protein
MPRWKITIQGKDISRETKEIKPVVLTLRADKVAMGKDCIFIESQEQPVVIRIEDNQDGISIEQI